MLNFTATRPSTHQGVHRRNSLQRWLVRWWPAVFADAVDARKRMEDILAGRAVSTAFQPIRYLDTGCTAGAEALTRFPGWSVRSAAESPEAVFARAASSGCVTDLEFLAMERALHCVAALPACLYVSVNLSPQTCLDPRIHKVIQASGVNPSRIVLELTEHSPVADYEALRASLALLRDSGLRIAVDDTGAGFASMRHVLKLKPEFIKLDRDMVAGIDSDDAKKAFGAAMVSFANGIGAVLVAEGIETEEELATLKGNWGTCGPGLPAWATFRPA